MGYYHSHFNVKEFKTYRSEDGRLHLLELHKHSELTVPTDFLIIRNSDHHSFVWVHHSQEISCGLIWPSLVEFNLKNGMKMLKTLLQH